MKSQYIKDLVLFKNGGVPNEYIVTSKINEEKIMHEFRLKNIGETRNYFIEETNFIKMN